MIYIILIFTFVVAPPVYSKENAHVEIQTFVQSFKDSIHRVSSKIPLPEEVGLNISEYLDKYNYPFESHELVTEDGYIVTLHRIPAGADKQFPSAADSARPAALFVPGLLCSSIDWVTLGPNKSLALLMADLDYDIWLLNTRGSKYSMNHEILNSSEAAFWDYSFHEKGYYDIAASIDYVINSTGLEKITAIGHSEGTSGIMVLTSSRPEYNDKLNLLVLLSPIGYMGGVRSPIPVLLTKYIDEIKALLDGLDFHGLPYDAAFSKAILTLCSVDNFHICSNLVQLLCGYDLDELSVNYFMVLMADKPNGISVKQLVHYGQEILTASFRQYDFGTTENIIHYGAPTPPSYNSSKITAPVAAYYSQNDFFAGVSDVEYLLSQMPNKADAYLIEYEKFNHLDFISAIDAKMLLYDRVLTTVAKYNLPLN